MKTVCFGIIGLGNISHRFMKGMTAIPSQTGNVSAVASRDCNKAKSYAEQYHIPTWYGSYEDLVRDPDIDVIYIATPQKCHFEHVMLCLQNNKHVICEKPFTVTKKEAEEIFDLAKIKQRFVMEAQKSVFLPTTHKVKQWLDENAIGTLQFVEASYCYQGHFPADHFIFEQGGGSLYDVGVYPLSFLDAVISSPIKSMKVHTHLHASGVDLTTQLLLEYEAGIQGYVRSSIEFSAVNRACLYGDQGWIEVPLFWKSQDCFLHRYDGQEVHMKFPHQSEFMYQIQEAITCIQQGKLESDSMNWQRTMRIMELLDQGKKHSLSWK